MSHTIQEIKLIINKKDRFLIQRYLYLADNIWDIPSVRLSNGEDHVSALKRLIDELGISVDAPRIISQYSKFNIDTALNYTYMIYECDVQSYSLSWEVPTIDIFIQYLWCTKKDFLLSVNTFISSNLREIISSHK